MGDINLLNPKIEQIKKIKITPRKITFWFYFIVFNLTLIILIFISLFLYKNLYQSITQSKEIIVLREKVVTETVNINKFNQIMDKLTKKTNRIKLNGINNLFD